MRRADKYIADLIVLIYFYENVQSSTESNV